MSNTITAFFKGRVGVAEAVYQNDYGIVMILDSIELPAHFDCYFSTLEQDEAIPGIGVGNRVAIPNDCLTRAGNVTLHIPLHTGANDSEVEYIVYFKVIKRARPVDDGTPVQMSAIERALALLQDPIGNIEDIVNEALSFTGETFDEMKADLNTFKDGIDERQDLVEAQVANLATNVKANTVTTLWEGTLDTKGQSVTLSEDISNYDFIDIYTSGVDTVYLRKPVSNTVSFEIQVQNMSDTASVSFIKWAESNLTISGKTATLNRTVIVSWEDFSAAPVVSEATSTVPITRIDGVKIGSHESAELIDGRVGADGVTYGNIGTANRTQFTALKNIIGAYLYGDNLVTIVPASKTHVGITFTPSGNSVIANGTATGNSFIDVAFFTPLKTGVYYLSGCPTGGGASTYRMMVGGMGKYDEGNGQSYILTAGTEYKIRCLVYKDYVADNLVFTPVLKYVDSVSEYTDKVNGVEQFLEINDFQLEYAAWQRSGKEPSSSHARACSQIFHASGTFTITLRNFLDYRFSVVQFPIDANEDYIDSGWKTSAYTVTVDRNHSFALNFSRQDNTAIESIDALQPIITSGGFHWHLATVNDIKKYNDTVSKYIERVNGIKSHSEIENIELMYGAWQRSGKEPSASLKRVCSNLFFASGSFTISLEDYNGYMFSVAQYPINESGTYIDSGWQNSDYSVTIDSEHYFALNFSKSDNSAIEDIGVFRPSIISSDGFHWHLASIEDVETESEYSKLLEPKQYYYDHLFVTDIDKATETIIIPSESLANINASYRLGFNMIEANVKALNDGNFIVCHGSGSGGNYFGTQFEHVDGITDISGVAFADVDLAWVRANVRYRPSYAKYATYPSSLQEFLYTCKNYGMTALIQCTDMAVAKIADKIIGKNKWVAYNANREMTDGLIMSVYSPSNIEDALAKCYEQKKPYMLCLGNTTSFELDELKEIVEAVHAKGYLIGYVQYFVNEKYNQEYKNLGFDFCASTWSVNAFDSGNICNLSGDITFDDFTTNGVITNGMINLAKDNTVTPSEHFNNVFLGKGELNVVFDGRITVKMGRHIDITFNSETSPQVCISSYFLNELPTFTITADVNSTIRSISYKASKC